MTSTENWHLYGPTLAVAIIAALALYPTQASFAQAKYADADSSKNPTAPDHAGEQGETLEEVLVTAQKRSERLLSTPVSVTALSAASLEKANLLSPGDLAKYVPALAERAPGGDSNPIFSLRGVSVNDFSAAQSSPIALYTDEVYRSGPTFFSDQLYDLQRIEVLRGPQGTLYGKNATGGAINFITVEPGFDTEGYIKTGLGNYSRVEADGAYQQAITDKIAARVAFDYKNVAGFEKNVYRVGEDLGGTNEYGVRFSILFKPVDTLKVVLRAATSQTGPDPAPDKVFPSSQGIGGGAYLLFHNLYPLTNQTTDYFPSQHGVGPRQTSAGTSGFVKTTSNDFTLNVKWDITPTLALTSVTSFNDGYFKAKEDTDGSPLNVLSYMQSDSGQQYAEDLRLDYHGDSANLLGGIFYSNDDLSSVNGDSYFTDIDINGDGVLDNKDCTASSTLGVYPFGCYVGNSFHQNRVSEAIYSDGSYSLTDALKIRLGVRYTRDELNVSQYTSNTYGSDGVALFNNIPGNGASLFTKALPINDVFTKVSGRFGLDYTFDNGILAYGVLSRGYRGGAVNSSAYFQAAALTVAQPETLNSAEIGLKGEFFAHRLQIATSGFLYGYKNQQAVATNPQNLAYQEINIGRSSLQGVEIEVTGKPVEDVKIYAGLALLDTKINTAVVGGANLAGQDLPSAPKVTANFNIDWTAIKADAYTLVLSPGARYTGTQYYVLGLPSGTAGATNQGAYWLFDARATVALETSPVTLSLWVKNLGDKSYNTSQEGATSLGIEPVVVLGLPRTFGIEAKYLF